MPQTILVAAQRRAFAAFPQNLDEYALARYFTLTQRDQELIARSRGDHNRLGLVCQLSWLRWLGWQPEAIRGAPEVATVFLAQQLNVSPAALQQYPDHPRTWWRHAEQARQHLGWRAYQADEASALAAHLLKEALQYDHARGLLEAALAFLRREKILRPGLTPLERAVTAARTRAEAHLTKALDGLLNAEQKAGLEKLLAEPDTAEATPLQVLKDPPGQANCKNLHRLLDKIEVLRALGIEDLDLSAFNPNRRKILTREARRLYPVHLRRLPAARRHALLVCLLAELLLAFNDQAVETHDQVLREMRHRAQGRRKQELSVFDGPGTAPPSDAATQQRRALPQLGRSNFLGTQRRSAHASAV